MATYEIRPLQLKILDTLLTIDEIFEGKGLKYYIMAGTMLGAIRHKGFIPWDDDLDIGMPREDYDKLIKNHKEWLPYPFEFVCAETDSNYNLPFGKIQNADTTLIERAHLRYLGGIYIDVFPLDGVPDNSISRRLNFARYEYYKRVLYLMCRDPYKHGHGPSSWIPLLCRKLYSLQEVQQKIRRVLTKYSFEKSSLVADYDDGLKGVMQKEILGNPTPVLFEEKYVKGVEQYDKYLTQKYGNYMTPPPMNKARQHNFYFMDLNMPYREWAKQNDLKQ